MTVKKVLEKYEPSKIESKWQKVWEDSETYVSDPSLPNTHYVLAEFAYPSGDLHMGHWFTFSGADIYARFKRMQGLNVFFPNGFDAFGLPAENAAIKRNIHPQDWTMDNIKKMKDQYRTMGASFSFKNEVITCLPEYYKWNQWIFLKMMEKGIAYQSSKLSNWCPNDQTVLANEHVENGKCWRCGAEVEQKEVKQWFLKITDYADRLLWSEDLEKKVNWPDATRTGQNIWIGKSEGAVIAFKINNLDRKDNLNRNGENALKSEIRVFTTRPDTLHGATFMVLAPEHPVVDAILSLKSHLKESGIDTEGIGIDIDTSNIDEATKNNLQSYVSKAKKKTEMERKENKDKTGVFSGLYCINPINQEKIPVWVADYVLSGYGTGAIMAVPAHDERDFEFAKKFNLPIRQVIAPDHMYGKDLPELEDAYIGSGGLVNSSDWDDFAVPVAMGKILDSIEEKKIGKREIQYHLHDWSVSRQRYWGTPVPVIHCDKDGIVPVPEENLPVELPYDVDYAPHGKAPLATNSKWLNVACPKCGGDATRDPETLDTFFDSSWYFFRFLSPHYNNGPFEPSIEKNAMPVDVYFGGAEHTLGHTLYSRFFTKFFNDIGLTNLEEYAAKRVNHGVILGPDGNRMSKSKGNVVNPDDEVKKYGADTIRVYLAFFMPYESTGPWISDRVWGAHRFLQRVWGLYEKVKSEESGVKTLSPNDLYNMHKTIKKVTNDIENVQFNTAIASLMEWLNHLSRKEIVSEAEYKIMIRLLAPFAPHMTEEIWQKLGENGSVHVSDWPEYDKEYLSQENTLIVIQVNGKRRGEISVESSKLTDQEFVEKEAFDKVEPHLVDGVKKTIYITGKIINFVV